MRLCPPASHRLGVRRLRSLLLASFGATAVSLGTSRPAAGQTTWDGGTSGTGTAFGTNTNWAGDVTPGSSSNTGNTDIASFGSVGTSTSITLNFNSALGTPYYLGTVRMVSGSVARSFGSNTVAPGVLVLNGSGANDLILDNQSSNAMTFNLTDGTAGAGPLSLSLSKPNGTINAVGAITVNVNVTEQAAGAGFTTTGSGVVTFNAANTFTGAVTVNAGTLTFNGSNAIGGGITVNAGTFNLSVTGSNTTTGSGGMTVGSGATLNLVGVNGLTGATAVATGGLVRYGSVASVGGAGRANVTLTNATAVGLFAFDQLLVNRLATPSTGVLALSVSNANDLDLSRLAGIALGAAGGTTVNPLVYSGTLTPNGSTYTLGGGGGVLGVATSLADGPASASRSLTVAAGTVVLSAANSFTGTTTVAATGTLRIGNGGPAGSLNGAISNAGTLILNRSDNATLTQVVAGPITGAGGLIKLGAGTLTINAAQSYSGPTTLAAGTLALAFGNTAPDLTDLLPGTSTFTAAGGTLSLVGAAGVANSQTFGAFNLASGGTTLLPTAGAGGTLTVALGNVTRTAGGAGTVNLAVPSAPGTVTAVGTPVVNGIIGSHFTTGVLNPTTSAVGNLNWATLDAGNNVVGLAYTTGTGSNTFGGAAPALTAANTTPTMNVLLNGLTSNGSFTGAPLTINSLKFFTTYTTTNTFRTMTVTSGNTLRVGAGGVLVPAGSANFVLGSSGVGAVTAGTADNTAAELFFYAGGFTSGGTTGGDIQVNSPITNNGTGVVSVTKSGPGILTIEGSGTFTGTITVNEGSLNVRTAANLGNGSALVLRGGSTLRLTSTLTGDITTGRSPQIDGPVTVEVQGTNAVMRFNSLFTGSGTITKTGPGGLSIGTVNTSAPPSPFNGSILVSAGRLTNGSTSGTLPNALVDLATSTTLDIANGPGFNVDRLTGTGSVQPVGTVGSTGSTFVLGVGAGNGDSTFSGRLLTNPAAAAAANTRLGLAKNGTGTFVLAASVANAAGNTYTDGTSVNGGVLQFNAANLIGGSTANVLVNPGAAVAAGGSLTGAGLLSRVATSSTGALALTPDLGPTNAESLDFSAFSALSLGAVGSVTYSGTLTPNGTTYRLGGGGGTLTYAPDLASGTFVISGPGKVALAGAVAAGVGVTNNNVLVLAPGTASVAAAGTISGPGLVQKLGANTSVLTGTNTHSGGTVVSAGVLELNAAAALPTVGDVVLAGGTLRTNTAGTAGTITAFQAGSLRVTAASTLALDPAAAHTITFSTGLDGTGGGSLLVTGWTGTTDASGTTGRIVFTAAPLGADLTSANAQYQTFLSGTTFDTFSPGATFITGPSAVTYELVPTAIPEPATALGLAAAGLGLVRVRRRVRAGA